MKNLKLSPKFAWIVGTIMFSYLLLRALFNEPLHDELMTFYFYIYHGDYYGANIMLDANNHWLNSLLGHLMYPLAKNDFFWYRLPSLLSFIPFCIGVYRLCLAFKTEITRIFAFIAFLSIPFYLEYFAYTRGYGISIGFFFLGLAYTKDFFQNNQLKSLIILLICLWVCIASNLTFLTISLIIVALLSFKIFQSQAFRFSQLWARGLFIVMFLISMVPFLQMAFLLKESKALYYGGLDGYWEITGKSLMKYTFFQEGVIGQIILALLLLSFVFSTILILRKVNLLKEFSFDHFVPVLFWGHFISIFVMAKVMEVNYPEDRVAFPLLLLGLWILVYFLDYLTTYLKFAPLVLVYFPLSFVATASLSTSIFSPSDRITKDFYQKVKNEMKPEHSLMIYHIMRYSWAWNESQSEVKSSRHNNYNPNNILSDILVTKTDFVRNKRILELYDTIVVNRDAQQIAFKRKKPIEKIKLSESAQVDVKQKIEYLNLWEVDTLSLKPYQPYQLTVKGNLTCFNPMNKLQLIFASYDEAGNLGWYEFHPFEYEFINGEFLTTFQHHFLIEKLEEFNHKIKVYLWSRNMDSIQVSNAKCYLYQLNLD